MDIAARSHVWIGRLPVLFVAVVSLFAFAAPAHAAYPGANGKIAFQGNQDGNPEIYTINPDGSDLTRLTNNPAMDRIPVWSPDGDKIAFTSTRNGPENIYVMDADGSDVTRLTSSSFDFAPSWSPDGQKIAFYSSRGGPSRIYVMNADGSNQTAITSGSSDFSPTWSPDGQKIAFVGFYGSDVDSEIYVMNANGSGLTNLTNDPGKYDHSPDWSPDGGRIAFVSDRSFADSDLHVFVMNPDGSDPHAVTQGIIPSWSPDAKKFALVHVGATAGTLYLVNSDGTGETAVPGTSGVYNPDWQPRLRASYSHPQSALSLSTSLVPVFKECGTGGNPVNASHAPPLSVGSCSPPSPSSAVARVGAQMQGSAELSVVPGDTDPTNGNQADVALMTTIADVQTAAGVDYDPNVSGPDLTQVTRVRFTDQANGYGGTSATAHDVDFSVPIDCAPTLDPLLGSECAVDTTANSVMPGLVQEERQAVVQVFRVRVHDSGQNGVNENGTGDDKIFLHEGIFTP